MHCQAQACLQLVNTASCNLRANLPAPPPNRLPQVFDSQTLALFTSSLFLAGLFTAPVASIVTRKYGRKLTMLCAGISFLIGSSEH